MAYSGQRPAAMEESCMGNQGPQRIRELENEDEEEHKEENREKKKEETTKERKMTRKKSQ